MTIPITSGMTKPVIAGYAPPVIAGLDRQSRSLPDRL